MSKPWEDCIAREVAAVADAVYPTEPKLRQAFVAAMHSVGAIAYQAGFEAGKRTGEELNEAKHRFLSAAAMTITGPAS